ncbi:MAG: LptF/LptG family permease [Candidatus Eremiobacteraeota bacterium]|nr:LptF/LptG family permease [Candidatus Eremiobacteraeota bacterium]
MKLLDRYMAQELGGPFLFGLAAFTLLFVAGQLLNIARLVSEEHASAFAAAKYFVYTLPATLVLTIPMSMLLAVLLAMGRLSGDSELTAMRAGGISLYRVAAPLIAIGFVASLVALLFQEDVVPAAAATANDILRREIQSGHGSLVGNSLVSTVLPNGDLQVTYAQSFDQRTEELQSTTVEVFRHNVLTSLLFAPRAKYGGDKWTFFDAKLYQLTPACCKVGDWPVLNIDIGADPTELLEQTKQPEDMSRAEIARYLGRTNRAADPSRYALLEVTYHSKLARPFTTLVFTLLAMPLGVRPQRSSSGAGFGISIALIFAFYVVTTVCLAIGRSIPASSFVMAWLPNVAFCAAGLRLMQKAAMA